MGKGALKIRILGGLSYLIIFISALAFAKESPPRIETLAAIQEGREALVDTLYYDYENWKTLFRKKLTEIDPDSGDIKDQINRMIYSFYLAGISVEQSYTLGMERNFRLSDIEGAFYPNIKESKKIAGSILNHHAASSNIKALAYMFLAGAEGYIAKYEYMVGNALVALVNAFWVDINMEKALASNPDLVNAHVGLGMYRYVNSRLGGIGNFIMQRSHDKREIGINHLKHAIRSNATASSIAYRGIIWAYISEQLNPKNRQLTADHPLSRSNSREKALKWIQEYEERYFKSAPTEGFIGNKELEMMKGVHYLINEKYKTSAKHLQQAIQITKLLEQERGFRFNPDFLRTLKIMIKHCELMALSKASQSHGKPKLRCFKIDREEKHLSDQRLMIESDTANIGRDLKEIIIRNLGNLSRQWNCNSQHGSFGD